MKRWRSGTELNGSTRDAGGSRKTKRKGSEPNCGPTDVRDSRKKERRTRNSKSRVRLKTFASKKIKGIPKSCLMTSVQVWQCHTPTLEFPRDFFERSLTVRAANRRERKKSKDIIKFIAKNTLVRNSGSLKTPISVFFRIEIREITVCF